MTASAVAMNEHQHRLLGCLEVRVVQRGGGRLVDDGPDLELRLLGGEPHGLAVDLVEGAGDLADLVAGVDRDGLYAGVHAARVGARELVDQHRQTLLGDAEGGVAQLAHRAGHLAGHGTGQDEREQQRDDDGGTGDQGCDPAVQLRVGSIAAVGCSAAGGAGLAKG